VSEATLLSPEQVQEALDKAQRLLDGLNQALLGQEELTKLVLTGALARGHVLLEGLPGLGKTELVKAMSALLGLEFRRVQFTPDLLPGDITGGHILEESGGGRQMKFHPGPVFSNLLLADEINRASPKTQSALLEAMQERCVTVLGETHTLPQPFFVLATQNPIELEGTYPLPEAQLDRFLFKVEVSRVGPEVLQSILMERRRGAVPDLQVQVSREELEQLFEAVDQVFLPNAVAAFIARIVEASHPDAASAPEMVKNYIRYGASPRAAIAIAETARSYALLRGKPNAGFDDVRAVTPSALGHRCLLDYRAKLDGVSTRDVVAAILEQVSELEESFPREVEESSQ
jgi:MoxR-like ATPase